jgi:ATP synthase protein I
MPQPDPTDDEALKRLDGKLRAFESKRAGPASSGGDQKAAGEAYRMMAGLIGGLLGGLGLGWTFDYAVGHFVHTSPWGLVGGLLIGVGLSTYSAVRTAGRMSASARAASGPVPAVHDDEDDD